MRKRLRRLGILLIFLLMMMLIMNLGLVLTIAQYGKVNRAEQADVIIVLGAGNRSVIGRRSAHGAELWHQGFADFMICTGGDSLHSSQSEAEVCRDNLIDDGVPEDVIFMEITSRSTEENAIEARKIMEDHGWQSAVLVSDNYHLWRAHMIFSERLPEGWQTYPSPAQTTQDNGDLPHGWRTSMFREILATYWYVGKSLLGLPYTDFPKG